MGKKVVIVGGVAGGASAAARLRRLDESAEIVMLERDEHISFANCGLPYYIGETIKDRNKLLVQTPEAMRARFNIDVRTFCEVTSIDIVNKIVTVNSKANGIYEESYDYLILSPGAKAIKPGIPGIDSNRIFTLRNIPDTDRIKAFVDTQEIKSAIVIGAGYIGIEMAENLKDRGLDVTLVEAAPHIMGALDGDMAAIIEKELVANEIALVLNDGVAAFHDDGSSLDVKLRSGIILKADMAVLAIGVTPDTGFIKGSGVRLGKLGHIIVNEKMETNIDDILAVGDAVEVVDYVTGSVTAIPLAGPANKQGRIAADNVAGLDSVYRGTQGTSIIKVFGLTAAATGANEKSLKEAGLNYKSVIIHPVSHASYYPGALPLSFKLLYAEDGKVLGAQGVGYDGVDKRIDVIATVIRLGGTIHDLTQLELSYAPPFSSAKDPVNMAGYVAENILNGKAHAADWHKLKDEPAEGRILLDVRSELEYANGNLPGSVNIPLDKLRSRLSELDKDKKIVIYCQVGLRGYVADRILSQKGYDAVNINGGYKTASLLDFAPPQIGGSNSTSGLKGVEVVPDTQVVKEAGNANANFDKALDACGLCCPGPLMQVKAAMDELKDGQILKVTASDPGFLEDIKAWSQRTNNTLIDVSKNGGHITALIRKGTAIGTSSVNFPIGQDKDNKTIVVFSGDLDKALASFIIANGAASMGKKVTMFFTFWGLNVLRKAEKVSIQKEMMDRMFGAMMPRGSRKLKLSNMNMMGMGGKMIRKVMKDKNISSLEELIMAAQQSGIELVACQMSMDVMGLKKEELIDGIKIGGVGYYLGQAEDANINLFI